MPTFEQIKTPTQLKGFVENGSDSYYFTRDTMKFFGDTMRNYDIRKHSLKGLLVIELYRKRPVKHGLLSSHYFVKEELDGAKRIHLTEAEEDQLTKWSKK